MNRYRTIVVGVDFTAPSGNALRSAAHLARRHGSELHIIHLLHHEEAALSCRRERSGIADLIRNRWIRLEQFIDQWIPDHRDLNVRLDVHFGHHLECLMTAVEECHADLLVLGSRDHPSSERPLTGGSLANACIRNSPCEILRVSEHHVPPFKHVVVGVDFSKGSRRCIDRGLSVADNDTAELTIVHVYTPPFGRFLCDRRTTMTVETVENMRLNIKHKLEKFVNKWTVQPSRVRIHTAIVESPTEVEGLLGFLAKSGADLLVSNVHEDDTRDASTLGPSAEQVVLRAGISILTVKPEVPRKEERVRTRRFHRSKTRAIANQYPSMGAG